MRVLLDECLPRKLKRFLPEHEVWTTPDKGWAGKRNGTLLGLAQADFDAFLTIDQNLRFQQRVSQYEIGVVVLVAPSNALVALQPLMPAVLEALKRLRNGQVILVGA